MLPFLNPDVQYTEYSGIVRAKSPIVNLSCFSFGGSGALTLVGCFGLGDFPVAVVERQGICIRRSGPRRCTGQIDAFLGPGSMLEHQRRDPGAFTVLKGLDDRMMLAMVVPQRLVHAGKIHAIEGNGVGGRERYTAIPLDGLGDDFASRSVHDEIMELRVDVAVAAFVQMDQVAFGENLIAFP